MSDSQNKGGDESVGAALVLRSAPDGHYRRLTVLIDGQCAGVIRLGETKRYPLALGDHDLVMRTGTGSDPAWSRPRWVNWFFNRYYSPRFSFVIQADADYEAVCGSHFRSAKQMPWGMRIMQGLLPGLLVVVAREIQNAWFPQNLFSLGKAPDAFILFLILSASLHITRYWGEGPIWCKPERDVNQKDELAFKTSRLPQRES